MLALEENVAHKEYMAHLEGSSVDGQQNPGPGCSKLTRSLFIFHLNFEHKYLKYADNFC